MLNSWIFLTADGFVFIGLFEVYQAENQEVRGSIFILSHLLIIAIANHWSLVLNKEFAHQMVFISIYAVIGMIQMVDPDKEVSSG